jgi:hypothetical protein
MTVESLKGSKKMKKGRKDASKTPESIVLCSCTAECGVKFGEPEKDGSYQFVIWVYRFGEFEKETRKASNLREIFEAFNRLLRKYRQEADPQSKAFTAKYGFIC